MTSDDESNGRDTLRGEFAVDQGIQYSCTASKYLRKYFTNYISKSSQSHCRCEDAKLD